MFKSKIYLLITILGIIALAAGACTPVTPTETPEPTTLTEEDINFRFLISDEVNAIARFVWGLKHDDDHLGQITEIVRQAREARRSLG